MKRLVALFAVLVLVSSVAYATPDKGTEEAEGPKPICPVTKISGDRHDCMSCHELKSENGGVVFGLKEIEPFAGMSPPAGSELLTRDGETVLWYLMTGISDYSIKNIYDWLLWHDEIDRLVIEVQSPGGSLFASQRIVGIMDAIKSMGVVVETRCYGFAASAGFYILVNGSQGHRYAAPQAQLMWHELITFAMFDISAPADKEDEARVLRHLQDTVNERIAKVSHIEKTDLDRMIRKKELWVNGEQALEKGFVDNLTEM